MTRYAHRINAGTMPDISNGQGSDFFFIDIEKQVCDRGLDSSESAVLSEEAAAGIVELVRTKLPRYYRLPSSEIQVLTPMQRGMTGAANLNQMLQQAINANAEGLRRGGTVYCRHDKVMQIRNNYEQRQNS